MAKDDVQKMIVEGASELFLQHGCKRVTMDQIAQYLHISKRTIYEQFADKGALLDACLEAKFNHISHPHPTLSDDMMPILMMLAMVQVHADTMNRHELMMTDIKEHYPEIYDRHIGKIRSAFVASLTEIMNHDQKLGRIRSDVDTSVAAQAVVAMAMYDKTADVFGAMTDQQVHKVLSEVVYTYMRGLLTESFLKEYETRKESLLEDWRTMIARHAECMCGDRDPIEMKKY